MAGNPRAVLAWWNALSAEEREALKISDPDTVGNTDGIPVGDRDDANRTSLNRDLDSLEGRGKDRTDAQDQQLTRAQAALDALKKGTDRIDPATGLPLETFLMMYARPPSVATAQRLWPTGIPTPPTMWQSASQAS